MKLYCLKCVILQYSTHVITRVIHTRVLTQGEYTKPAEVLNQETGFVAPRGLGGATTFTDDTIPVYSMCMQREVCDI